MMKTIKALCSMGWFPILLGCLLFAACSDDDVVKKGDVVEGLPVSLKFTLTVPQLSEAPVTRASDAVETQLQQLALFFYKDDTNAPVFVKEIDNFGNGPLAEMGSQTNYFYEIEIPQDEGLTSGSYKLYAIANWNNAFCDIDLNECRGLSLNELKSRIISRLSSNNTLDLIGYTPMSGKFGPKDGDGEITLEPGENMFTGTDELIRLRRAVAKVTFKFESQEGVIFNPESYSIYNFSLSSTLLERTGWQDENGTKPGNPGELQYSGNDTFRDFEDLKFTDATPNEFTFYMLENVQHAIKTEGLTKALREKRDLKEDNTRGDFTYAPKNSTYIVVKGYYEGPGKKKEDGTYESNVSGNVSYTIQLGDFDETHGGVDNFTIRRNVKYIYTVKVAGVNNIITEAVATDADGEVQPGAEGDLIATGAQALSIPLDAHYEKVLLRIPSGVLENPLFYVNTPFSQTGREGIQPNAAGATITDDSKDCDWIHFAKPIENEDGTITFGMFNNGQGLVNIFGLLQELPNRPEDKADGEHYLVRNGYVYTTAYVDEYYYTKNPNGGPISLSDFINKPDRVMNICTTKSISLDGSSSYVAETIISFRQNAIYTMYPLSGITNPFGIEKKNEWSHMTRDTTTVDNDLTINEGWKNTQKLIGTASHDMSAVGYTFADGANKPTFSTGTITDPKPYIAVMTRNRDSDDNGVIDDDEMKWYIPARNQCLALWMGNNDLGDYRPYNASGLESETKVDGPAGLIHTSSGGKSLVWWAIEGASFGDQTESYDMRCVRNLNDDHYKEVPTQFSKCNNYIITVNGLSDNCLRTGMMTGEYSAGHTERMVDNRLPAAFEVAKNDLTVTTEGKEGDEYVPDVTIGEVETNRTSSGRVDPLYTVTYSIPLTISRVNGHKYYVNTSASLEGATEISGESYQGKAVVEHRASEITLSVKSRIYILAENGNYATISPTASSYWGTWTYSASKSTTVLNENKTVAGTTINTWDSNAIKALVNLAAANYTQEADGSDKGQWRVPNQRELGLMMVYNNDIGLGALRYASSTFFTAGESSKKTRPFQLDNSDTSNPFITLADVDVYYIRPVRDVTPETSSAKQNDSSYPNNGMGFGVE